MHTSEARVFIIDDDERKQERLTTFIEAAGGQVVGSVVTRDDAEQLTGEGDFPAAINGANTVLIDGNLDPDGSGGTDGKHVFRYGYQRAVLHRVDADEGIGAVGIGCSSDPHAEVANATGGNLTRLYEDDAPDRWVALLDPHPAEPVYLSPGIMERLDFSGGFPFGVMLQRLIKPADHPAVLVHALAVTETRKTGPQETVTYTDDIDTAAEIETGLLVARAGNWQDEDVDARPDTHTVKALVQAGGVLYVVTHASRMHRYTYGREAVDGGKVDKIAVAGIAEIPDAYWQNLGLDRPDLRTAP